MNFSQLLSRARSCGKKHASALVAALWLSCALGGWAGITWAASVPGKDAAAPAEWPSASTLERSTNRPTLLLFAHPKCPCTEASLAELARITADGARVRATVVFYQPEAADERWAQTRLWAAAGEIPGVQRVVDRGGNEAQRFAASTAGRTLVYGADGRLLFAGGITLARGHRGDNPGESAIVALLHAQPGQTSRTPVFGCPIFKAASTLR